MNEIDDRTALKAQLAELRKQDRRRYARECLVFFLTVLAAGLLAQAICL